MKKKIFTLLLVLLLSCFSITLIACEEQTGNDGFSPFDGVSDQTQDDENASDENGETTVAVESISLNKETLDLLITESQTLTATVLPENATNKKFTWSSSATDVASVDENGKVTALKKGVATITATTEDGNKTASCIVTVIVPVTSVALNKNTVQLELGVKITETLVATVLPENATNKNVSWASSDSLTVSVDNDGVITALKTGTATITVTTEDGEKVSECDVTVIPKQTLVSLVVNNQEWKTVSTDESKNYQIPNLDRPEDMSTNSNLSNYFYGWFTDANCQTPYVENSQFLQPTTLYGYELTVDYDDYEFSEPDSHGNVAITGYTPQTPQPTLFSSTIDLSNLTLAPCTDGQGHNVTKIGNMAFYNIDALKTVIIGDGIVEIEESAFSCCYNLEKVVLPDSLETLGSSSFSSCSKLDNVSLPDSITSMGNNVFSGCESLTQVKLPSGLTTLPAFTFDNTGITEFTIPSTITTIDSYAFQGCVNLVTIYINGIKTFKDGTFSGCTGLENVVFSGSLADWTQMVYTSNQSYPTPLHPASSTYPKLYVNNEIKESNFVQGVVDMSSANITTIKTKAFYYYKHMTGFIAPNTLQTIEGSAFSYCVNLTSLTLPAGLQSLGSIYAGNCSKLEKIDFKGTLNQWMNISYAGYTKIFSNNEKLYTSDLNGDYLKEYTFSGYNVVPICFSGYKHLTKITILDATEIKNYAFDSVPLTHVYLPASLTKIGSNVFNANYSLAEIHFAGTIDQWAGINFVSTLIRNYDTPYKLFVNGESTAVTKLQFSNSLTKISNYAFYKVSNVEEIVLGDAVNSIGAEAFAYCDNLTKITFNDILSSLNSSAFTNCAKLKDFVVPSANTNFISMSGILYIKNASTPSVVDFCIIPKGLTGDVELPVNLNPSNTNLYSFPIKNTDNSITGITIADGNSKFLSCDKVLYRKDTGDILYQVFVPSGLNPTDGILHLPEGLASASLELNGNANIKKVIFPSTVNYVGSIMFKGLPNLTEITIPDAVTSISSETFKNCTALTTVTLGANTTTISSSAFSGCSQLTTVNGLGRVVTIGSNAFRDCVLLELTEDLVNAVTIEQYAFCGCTSIEKIENLNNIKTIGTSAFMDCTALTTLSMTGNTEEGILINDQAFKGCAELKTISLGDRYYKFNKAFASNSYYLTFKDCAKIENVTAPFEAMMTIFNSVNQNSGNSVLKTITINRVESISSYPGNPFSSFRALTSITVVCTNEYLSSENGILYNADKSKVISVPIAYQTAVIDLADTVTTIGANSLCSIDDTHSITIEKNITMIEGNAFNGAKLVLNWADDITITTIAPNALSGYCGTYLEIPDQITDCGINPSYGNAAYQTVIKMSADKLADYMWSVRNTNFNNEGAAIQKIIVTSGELPSSIFNSNNAFKNLEEIVVGAGVTKIDGAVFNNKGSTPKMAKFTFEVTTGWVTDNSFAESVEISTDGATNWINFNSSAFNAYHISIVRSN